MNFDFSHSNTSYCRPWWLRGQLWAQETHLLSEGCSTEVPFWNFGFFVWTVTEWLDCLSSCEESHAVYHIKADSKLKNHMQSYSWKAVFLEMVDQRHRLLCGVQFWIWCLCIQTLDTDIRQIQKTEETVAQQTQELEVSGDSWVQTQYSDVETNRQQIKNLETNAQHVGRPTMIVE